jgi:hypothetical protein
VTGYRKRRLEPWVQRLRRIERGLRGGHAKRQRVYRITLAGRDLKQIVFSDAFLAERSAAHLDALADTGLLPRKVARYANELWVEFIEGAELEPSAPPPERELAELFAALYMRAPRPLAAEVEALRAETRMQLALLRDVGVIDAATLRGVEARCLADPAPVLARGYDYLDARPGNFLRDTGGRLRILDLESLAADEIQGIGAARAWLRWPGLSREGLVSGIARAGGPDLTAAAAFLELRFAAAWTVRSLLLRKPKLVDPSLFRRLAQAT